MLRIVFHTSFNLASCLDEISISGDEYQPLEEEVTDESCSSGVEEMEAEDESLKVLTCRKKFLRE